MAGPELSGAEPNGCVSPANRSCVSSHCEVLGEVMSLLEIASFTSKRSLDEDFWRKVSNRMLQFPGLTEFAGAVVNLVKIVFESPTPKNCGHLAALFAPKFPTMARQIC